MGTLKIIHKETHEVYWEGNKPNSFEFEDKLITIRSQSVEQHFIYTEKCLFIKHGKWLIALQMSFTPNVKKQRNKYFGMMGQAAHSVTIPNAAHGLKSNLRGESR